MAIFKKMLTTIWGKIAKLWRKKSVYDDLSVEEIKKRLLP
jgi:hypothetical protein